MSVGRIYCCACILMCKPELQRRLSTVSAKMAIRNDPPPSETDRGESVKRDHGRFIKGHPGYGDRIIGHPNYNTELKGGFKKGNPPLIGVKNYAWKGNKVGRCALHEWVVRWLGKPSFCGNCFVTTRKYYQWANISHKYRRDVSDWMRLCNPCHQAYDGHRLKQWKTRRQNAA